MLLLGLLLLGVSELLDQVERHPVLDGTRALIAVNVSVFVLSWMVWAAEPLLTRAMRRLQSGLRHGFFPAALVGLVVFASVLRAHIAHPRLDSWLALGGAMLLLIASVLGSADSS